jgi:hypothetical protein
MTLPLRFRRAWLVGGWLLVLLAIYGSLTGNAAIAHSGLNDKFMHAATYATLSLWFAGIYPRSRYVVIGLGLFALGISGLPGKVWVDLCDFRAAAAYR